MNKKQMPKASPMGNQTSMARPEMLKMGQDQQAMNPPATMPMQKMPADLPKARKAHKQ